MDTSVLKEIGLQDGEITLYLSLLRLEDATATKLAQDTGLHRSHIYDLIEKLKEKGLVSYIVKNNTKYFRSVAPKRLLDFVKEKEEKIASLIPNLESIHNSGSFDVNVELFKGTQGIKTVLNDLLENTKEYLLFGTLKFEELMPSYIPQFVRILNEKKIKEKAILEEGTKIIPPRNNSYKYVSKEYLFPNAVIIYRNKVGIFIWQQPYFVILIESEQVATSYKKHFELLWSIAKSTLHPKNN